MDEQRLRKGITTSFVCLIISAISFAASAILIIYSIVIANWIYMAAFIGGLVASVIAILISRYIMDLGEEVIHNHHDIAEILEKLKLKLDLDRGFEAEISNANNVDTPHFILRDLNRVVYYETEESLSEIQIRTAYFSRKLFDHAIKNPDYEEKIRILSTYEYKGYHFYDAGYGSFVGWVRDNKPEDINDKLKEQVANIDSRIKFREVRFNK